jgi:hypothetical protein
LSSVAADEWLYVRSLPNSFAITAKSFAVCAAYRALSAFMASSAVTVPVQS